MPENGRWDLTRCLKGWGLKKHVGVIRVLSDYLLIYESVSVNLIYIFREFTKSWGVLYLNYILAYHYINIGPAYQMKYFTTSNPYSLFSMFNEQTYT
jgi:hypothetical protein